MSGLKKKSKKDPPVLTPLQQYSQTITSLCPSVLPLLQRVSERLEAIRRVNMHAEWQTAKQIGTTAMQTLSNQWMKHWSEQQEEL